MGWRGGGTGPHTGGSATVEERGRAPTAQRQRGSVCVWGLHALLEPGPPPGGTSPASRHVFLGTLPRCRAPHAGSGGSRTRTDCTSGRSLGPAAEGPSLRRVPGSLSGACQGPVSWRHDWTASCTAPGEDTQGAGRSRCRSTQCAQRASVYVYVGVHGCEGVRVTVWMHSMRPSL